MNSTQVEYDSLIPNNVNLSSDKKVLKALEKWHPGYIDWWKDLGASWVSRYASLFKNCNKCR